MRRGPRSLVAVAALIALTACQPEVTSGKIIDTKDTHVNGFTYHTVEVRDANGNTDWLTLENDAEAKSCIKGTTYPACKTKPHR